MISLHTSGRSKYEFFFSRKKVENKITSYYSLEIVDQISDYWTNKAT